jgi:solute carrier family 25 iron transporter 28/37
MRHAWKSIRNNKHSSQLWRGVGSVVLGAGPAHAIYFATYEYTKKALANRVSGDALIGSYSFAGACATIMADAVMTPFDVVKQRMQVSSGSATNTLITTAKNILKTEGLGAFYVSYPTTLLLNVPFQCVQFPTYEVIKSLLNPNNSYSPTTHIIAGGTAGALAAALTTPIDVIKTALQTRGLLADEDKNMIRGMKSAIKWVYGRQGWKGFGKGLSPRVLAYMPSTAICWTMYEYFKWVLGQ